MVTSKFLKPDTAKRFRAALVKTSTLLPAVYLSLMLGTACTIEPAPAARPEESVAVTVLHQKNTAFGQSELYISENAARFIGRGGDVIIATSAPDWKIILYSKSKNQAMVVSAEEAAKTSLGIFTGPIDFDRASTMVVDDNRLHIKALKVVAMGDKITTARDAVIFQERRKRIVFDSTLETAELCKISPEQKRFFHWVYNKKDKYSGVPIDMLTRYSDGSFDNPYHTESIEHTVKPTSFFAYPSGFKIVKERIDVLMSDDAATTLEDLWGSTKDIEQKHK